jgi:hypothetical protein
MLCRVCNSLQRVSSDKDPQHLGPIRRDDIVESYRNGCDGCDLISRLCPVKADQILIHYMDDRLVLESWNVPIHEKWAIFPFTTKSRVESLCRVFQGLLTLYRDSMASSASVLSADPRGTDYRVHFTAYSKMASRVH